MPSVAFFIVVLSVVVLNVIASSSTRYTKVLMLARERQSSLFLKSVKYEKKFYNIGLTTETYLQVFFLKLSFFAEI